MLLLLALLCAALSSFAQKVSRNSYGVNVSIGQPANFIAFVGASDITGNSLTADVRLYRRLTRKVRFETGLGFHQTDYTSRTQTPPFPTFHQEVQTIYLPALLRLNVSKIFFLQAGFQADIDIRNVVPALRQTGLGLQLGVGVAFAVGKKLMVQCNPYLHYNPLWLTNVDPIYLVDRGIRVGIRTR